MDFSEGAPVDPPGHTLRCYVGARNTARGVYVGSEPTAFAVGVFLVFFSYHPSMQSAPPRRCLLVLYRQTWRVCAPLAVHLHSPRLAPPVRLRCSVLHRPRQRQRHLQLQEVQEVRPLLHRRAVRALRLPQAQHLTRPESRSCLDIILATRMLCHVMSEHAFLEDGAGRRKLPPCGLGVHELYMCRPFRVEGGEGARGGAGGLDRTSGMRFVGYVQVCLYWVWRFGWLRFRVAQF